LLLAHDAPLAADRLVSFGVVFGVSLRLF